MENHDIRLTIIVEVACEQFLGIGGKFHVERTCKKGVCPDVFVVEIVTFVHTPRLLLFDAQKLGLSVIVKIRGSEEWCAAGVIYT